MHYLVKKLKELPEEQQHSVASEIIEAVTSPVETKTDKIALQLLSDYTEEAIERNKSFGKMQGISSGYPKIDDMTKGLVGGELVIVAGKTSYGKTTMCINIANKVALAGTPVLFVTLEMTKAEVASRYMFINGGNNEDYEIVSNLTVVQANDELDWKSIDGLVQNFINQFSNGLVVIDHLHYFTRELEQVAEDLGRITKELKKNAIRHNVPVILVSHVRKTGNNNDASMEDLRGSSYIAQDADIVLMVGRKKGDDHTIKIAIEKNRNRGYDFSNNVAELYLEAIKVSNTRPIFKEQQ